MTYRSTAKGKDQDGAIDEQRRWTRVFVRREGRWQQVHSQGTTIQEALNGRGHPRVHREIFDAFTERNVGQRCWRERGLIPRQWKKISRVSIAARRVVKWLAIEKNSFSAVCSPQGNDKVIQPD